MQPLWPVHDLLRYLKLLRQYKGKLVATKKGRALAETPGAFFDLVAPDYLYHSVHVERIAGRSRWLGTGLFAAPALFADGFGLLRRILLLFSFDEFQYGAQAFVLGDGRMRHPPGPCRKRSSGATYPST